MRHRKSITRGRKDTSCNSSLRQLFALHYHQNYCPHWVVVTHQGGITGVLTQIRTDAEWRRVKRFPQMILQRVGRRWSRGEGRGEGEGKDIWANGEGKKWKTLMEWNWRCSTNQPSNQTRQILAQWTWQPTIHPSTQPSAIAFTEVLSTLQWCSP